LRVERRAASLALATIPSGDEQLILGERDELLGLGARLEVARDRPPTVATHRLRPLMRAADAERHALGEAADEICMQQIVECGAVAIGERDIEAASLVDQDFVVHSSIPLKSQAGGS